MSRGIHVKPSVLMSQLQISFPAAFSSLLPNNVQVQREEFCSSLQLVPTAIGEKVAYCLLEICLILTRKNTIGSQLDLLCFLRETYTTLFTCRRCFLRYAKKKKIKIFSFSNFTFRNINFITLKTHKRTRIPIKAKQLLYFCKLH